MKKRVGDTLVEVTLAIGIFSMVAIAVVAVMTEGSSSTEIALETTLAREEIDTQAEALRFIHSAYLASVDSGTSDPYSSLWATVTSNAIDPSKDSSYLTYAPKTCQEVQNSSVLKNYGFFIDPGALASSNPSKAIIKYNSDLFKQTTTHPRLVYYKNGSSVSTGTLIDDVTSYNKVRAEGIYVIAVKDNSTKIVDTNSAVVGSGFYDFYIRTCWYGTGTNTPSAISTVIRLYNPPDAADRDSTPTVTINFLPNGGSGSIPSRVLTPGQSTTLPNAKPGFTNEGVNWLVWSTLPTGGGTTYHANDVYTAPASLSSNQVINLYAIWDRIKINYNINAPASDSTTNLGISYCNSYSNCYVSDFIPTRSDEHGGFFFKGWATTKTSTVPSYQPGQKIVPASNSITLYAIWERYEIIYNANGGSYPPANTYCMSIVACYLTTEKAEDGKYLPRRSGYEFLGWSKSSTATTASYSPGGLFTPTSATTTLYAVWKAKNEKITIKLTWGPSPSDLDSHVEGQKSNGTQFHAYYSNKVGSDIDGTTIAQLNTDITSGYGPETFTINTFGGRNYYYYVHNYSGSGSFTGATVEVSGPELGTLTYYSNNATGYGRYWNVFAYKDGLIVPRMTFTSSPEVSY